MNLSLMKLLLGICVFLLVILLMEWLLIGSSDNLPVELPASDQNRQSQEIELPDLVLEKQPLERYSDMVDRPLFIEGRKPVLDSEPDGGKQEQVSQIDDLILDGIYSLEGKMNALFRKQKRDKEYFKKSEGDDISGWLIKELQPDRAILERAGKQQTIMLRKPKLRAVAKPKNPFAVVRKLKNLNPKKQHD